MGGPKYIGRELGGGVVGRNRGISRNRGVILYCNSRSYVFADDESAQDTLHTGPANATPSHKPEFNLDNGTGRCDTLFQIPPKFRQSFKIRTIPITILFSFAIRSFPK